MSDESQVQVSRQPALLETLHGRLPQGVAIFDVDLRLTYANARWATFLAHLAAPASEPALGTAAADLLPGADDLHAAMRRCLATGEAVRLPGRPCAAQAGEMFWDVTLAPMVDGGRVAGLICVVDDATARILAERDATAKARLAAFRADVSQALASSDDVTAVLQACAEAMVRHAPAAFARIWVLHEAEDVYRLRASAGLYTRLDGTYSRIPAAWLREKTFAAYEPNVIDLLRTHKVRDPEWATANGLVAWANQPLTVRGRIVGFMAMFARQQFDDDTLAELAAVADAIAQFLEREHAEAALRERDVLLRDIFESAADGLLIDDLESGQVLETNPALRAMHGYPEDEFTRLTRADLVHPDSRDDLRDYLQAIKAGEASRTRLLHRRKDGSVFHAAIQGSPILYRSRPAALSIVRDVTREQEAHERLEQRVAERTRELSLLLDTSRSVASTLELRPLLALILDQLKSVVDYTGTAVLIGEGDALIVAGQRGPLSEEDARQIRYPVAGLAPVWERLRRGETIVIHDVRGESQEANVFRGLVGEDIDGRLAFISSCLWAPLVVNDELIGILSITSGQPGAFEPRQVELAAAVARQAAVAIANARLHEQSRAMAALEERQRLARELHDAVTQTLFSASLVGDVLPALWERNPERAREALEDLRVLTRGALAEMRTLLFELRPNALVEAPLADLLRHLGDAVTGRTRLPVTVTVEGVPPLAADVQLSLYRIAQEALNNVVKHAQASRIELDAWGAPDGAVRLRVRDDGQGFDPSGAPGGHFGLQSMRERAGEIGAALTVTSVPGQGTEVLVTWQATTREEE
ncbi:MAG: PAS domain S-box protein [Thermomicrobiaceae bacterium]|nr:PAS domain S-box protein [Thermomicrobiaceae bacterium]